eukprot:5854534-Pleurochrysis_carterae.AAC.3
MLTRVYPRIYRSAFLSASRKSDRFRRCELLCGCFYSAVRALKFSTACEYGTCSAVFGLPSNYVRACADVYNRKAIDQMRRDGRSPPSGRSGLNDLNSLRIDSEEGQLYLQDMAWCQ